MTPLFDMNPVGRFDDRAADYATYRPDYPREAIDAVIAELGPPAHVTAADIGAGTGISARALAARGLTVLAVEPGSMMRAAAEPAAGVTWIDGTAERTTLPNRSCQLVLCAQAFHWFKPVEALVEFARILVPHGRVALMWNRRSRTDALTAGYRQAILDAGGESQAEQAPFDPGVFDRSARFLAPTRVVFPHRQRLDLRGFIGRAQSSSYCPKEGPAAARLVDALTALHRQHADAGGFVELVYETEVYRAAAR